VTAPVEFLEEDAILNSSLALVGCQLRLFANWRQAQQEIVFAEPSILSGEEAGYLIVAKARRTHKQTWNSV
jgi:hypothetical protein